MSPLLFFICLHSRIRSYVFLLFISPFFKIFPIHSFVFIQLFIQSFFPDLFFISFIIFLSFIWSVFFFHAHFLFSIQSFILSSLLFVLLSLFIFHSSLFFPSIIHFIFIFCSSFWIFLLLRPFSFSPTFFSSICLSYFHFYRTDELFVFY